ncbi:hypothetical protein TSUD_215150 [Trifolium subterraneum]|uniref:Uncharacterized protein n=1 Tax=Trifolium subterraneum TaxID=3900 RepID=A0A2Z6MGM9_TRISU|nr:hypothetical protein TSUD_215150 [Trifolium subterraneum]
MLRLAKARNKAIFANGSFFPLVIVDEIKVMSWKWSLDRLKVPPCLFYEWTWDLGRSAFVLGGLLRLVALCLYGGFHLCFFPAPSFFLIREDAY